MRVTITGATGRIGQALVAALTQRGDEVTVLSRDPERARQRLGVDAVAWDPKSGPAPAEALNGRDAVVHLAGEDIAQRWTQRVKHELRDSREAGTRNLVRGIELADPRPRVLVSQSASGFYGPRGPEPVDESAPPGEDFLSEICVAWEREAERATGLGLRVAILRTAVVLDRDGGALEKMLPPFKLGVGGPVAGGKQYLPWIHRDDQVGLMLAALDGDEWSGPINAVAPEGTTNAEFSRALGRVLKRPTVLPAPAFGIKLLYGEMAQIVTTGVHMVPKRAQQLGYAFRYPRVEDALRAALAG